MLEFPEIERIDEIRKLRQLLSRRLLAKLESLAPGIDFLLLLLLLQLTKTEQAEAAPRCTLGQARDSLLGLETQVTELSGGL